MNRGNSAPRTLEKLCFAALAVVIALTSSCGGGGGDDGGTNPPPLTCDQNPNGAGCPTTGNIQVTVNGVPTDVPAPRIVLNVPDGTQQARDGSGTFSNLAPGSYAVVAQTTSNSPLVRHAPSPSQIDVTVRRGLTEQATFSYAAQSFGAVEFTVQGLPSGSSANFTYNGPSRQGTQPLREGVNTVPFLEPGQWTISLPVLGSAVPTVTSISATVTTGAITRIASAVAYGQTGDLDVTVTGLPSNTAAQGTIAGPNGWTRQFTGPELVRAVPVGSYTITPSSVSASGSTYQAGAQSGTVTAGATTRLTVTYALADPVLTIAGGGSGTGTGRVVSTPAGIDCTITDGAAAANGCSKSFTQNTSVLLSVTQGTLVGWASDCSGTGSTCSLTMSQNRRAQASFAMPAIIAIKTTRPVVIADRVQTTIVVQYSIENGALGPLTPNVSPAKPAPWLDLTIVGGTKLQATITATGLNPYSEQKTPYVANATISAPESPTPVNLTLKFAKTFDQPAGMAATVVRFHFSSNALQGSPAPANANTVVSLLDARSNSPIVADISEIDPSSQNWLKPPRMNANGQLVLSVVDTIPGLNTMQPAGRLPAGGADLLGTPIRVALTRPGQNSQCPAFSVRPDPICHVFIYYTADPWPKLLLRPLGVQLTPARDTASVVIERLNADPLYSIDSASVKHLINTCSDKIQQPPAVTPTKLSVRGDFSKLAQDSTFRCAIFLVANAVDSVGTVIQSSNVQLDVTLANLAADVITPSHRDLNIVATAGSPAPSADVVDLKNLGPNSITLGSPTYVNSTCPAGLLLPVTLSGSAIGQGVGQKATVAINPLAQQRLVCTATLRFNSTTQGVATEDVPVVVRLK